MKRLFARFCLAVFCILVAGITAVLHISLTPLIVIVGVLALATTFAHFALERRYRRLHKRHVVLKRYIVNGGFLALVLVGAAFAPSAARAQESTPEPIPVITVAPEATPVVVPPGSTVIVSPPSDPHVIYDAVPVSLFVPIILFVAAVAGGALAAVAYNNHTNVKALWQSTPAVIQTGGRTGLEFLLGEAAKTDTPLDDMALKELSNQLGYQVTVLTDGRIILTPDGPTSMATKL